MRGLYKEKYLIGVYDSSDHLVFVADNVKDLSKAFKTTVVSMASVLSHGSAYKYKLIDIFEKHDDIFAEEDKLFIEFAKENILRKTEAEYAKELGINLRTYYHKKYLKSRSERNRQETLNKLKGGEQ